MSATAFRSLVCLAGLVGVATFSFIGCSTPPKPRELEAFEKLKADPFYREAARKYPGLVQDAEQLFAKSTAEWESNDLEDSTRDALMGSIKLKTALARVEQDRAQVRMKAADADLAASEEEYGRVAKDLGQTTEQVTLLEKLAESKSSAAATAQQLSQEQQKAEAQKRVADAELALKTADTVEARTYAKVEYTSAADMLERAKMEVKNGNWPAAQTSADLAKSKAEQAISVAKPTFEQNEKSKSSKARNAALESEASAITGIKVRLERRGDVQRLVIPLQGLFTKKKTTITTGKDAVMDPLASLLKKYDTYPVQVIGHTDNRGKKDALLALSLARAQTVYGALISRGVDAKRFVVSGQGSEEPVVDNKTRANRDNNNRVEVVFLYQ